MPDIDSALSRLETALESVSDLLTGAREGAGQADIEVADLRAERDRLADEVSNLRKAHEEDARLRAEAAEAVKSALADLRGLVREKDAANA